MGGGSPKMPPAEQRRRCSYPTVEVLSVSSVCWVHPSVLVLFGRSCSLKNKACDRHYFLGATAGVRCAMVCRRWRGWCPGLNSFRFTIYRLSHGRRQSANRRWTASGTLALCPQNYRRLRGDSFFDQSEANSVRLRKN